MRACVRVRVCACVMIDNEPKAGVEIRPGLWLMLSRTEYERISQYPRQPDANRGQLWHFGTALGILYPMLILNMLNPYIYHLPHSSYFTTYAQIQFPDPDSAGGRTSQLMISSISTAEGWASGWRTFGRVFGDTSLFAS